MVQGQLCVHDARSCIAQQRERAPGYVAWTSGGGFCSIQVYTLPISLASSRVPAGQTINVLGSSCQLG